MNSAEIVSKLVDRGVLVTESMLEEIKAGIIPAEMEDEAPPVKIINNYTEKGKKRTLQDFFKYFTKRFHALEGMLRSRSELSYVNTINRLKDKPEGENVTIIGFVMSKAETRNKNIMLTLEDMTGIIKVVITQHNSKLFDQAKDIVEDEAIGISGKLGDGIIFCKEIIHPDIPFTELKKSPKEEYIAIIGDPHYGSKVFLDDEFDRMIGWLNGEVGNEEQRAIASKVRYVILPGDLIEGVGVYPGQEEDLKIIDARDQYKGFVTLLQKIPKRMRIIICPGNHDVGRLAEPQPILPKEFVPDLYEMSNVTLLSNPCSFVIGQTEEFPGFNILMYHGFSLIYYADNVPSIRAAGGQKRVELIMKFMLERRHLAPTHKSNQYIPETSRDPMVISRVPDIFITGHIHRTAASMYKNVTLVNSSCWTDITEDQEKRGLEPQPGRLPLINLQTREVKVINFYTR